MNKVFGTLISLAIGLTIAWKYYQGTPQYAIEQVLDSLEGRDRVTFNKYFDIKLVADKVIEDLIERKLISGFKPQIMQMLDMELKHTFTKSKIIRQRIGLSRYDKLENDTLFLKLDEINCSKRKCLFGVIFKDLKRDKDIQLVVKLVKRSGTWKVIELPEVVDIVFTHLEK